MDIATPNENNKNGNPIANPTQYAEYIFSKYITDIFANIQQGNGSFWNNIFIFMMVCSINEIKKGLGFAYTEIGLLIKDNYKNIFSLTMQKINSYAKIIYNFKNMFVPQKMEFDKPTDAFNTIYVNVHCNVQFMQSFVNYLIQNKYEYDKNDTNYTFFKVKNEQIFDIKDVETSNIDEIWHNITICKNDISISIKNDVKMSFAKNNSINLLSNYEISAEESDKTYDAKFYDNAEYFYELIKDKSIKKFIKDKYYFWTPASKSSEECLEKTFCDEYNNKNNLSNQLCEQYNIRNITNKDIKSGLYDNSLEFLILNTMIKKMQKLKIIQSFEQICLFVYLCKYILNFNDSDILNIFGITKFDDNENEKINFITFYGHKFTTSYFVKNVYIFVPASFYDTQIVVDFESKQEFNNLKTIEVNKISKNKHKSDRTNNFKSSFINKSNYLVFEITSEQNEEYMRKESTSFIEDIKLNGNLITKDKKKVNIYNVSYKENITTETVDNEEYETWTKLKDKVLEQGNSKTTDENKNTHSFIDPTMFMNMTTPPKTITKEIKTKKPEKTFIKNIYKNVDTIYLRENDMKKIKSFLDNFHNNKELMSSLGLSDKLVVLLHGLPGTGKTSLIYVIACFLQKDIYYVNFTNIKTNKDYQDIINYVQKNCGNAIIIFEDIDATTNVVHQRSEEIEDLTVNQIIDSEDEPLTLSYMLNSLDGALTADGSVIIMTTNYLNKLDKAIHREGRVDVKIEMKLCDHHQIKLIFKKFIKRDINEEILQKIPEDKYIPAAIIEQMRVCMNDSELTDMQIMEKFIPDDLISFDTTTINNKNILHISNNDCSDDEINITKNIILTDNIDLNNEHKNIIIEDVDANDMDSEDYNNVPEINMQPLINEMSNSIDIKNNSNIFN
jgi:ATP-dependent 26S proteasome regulatory subunit